MLGFTMAIDQSDSRTQPCHVRMLVYFMLQEPICIEIIEIIEELK